MEVSRLEASRLATAVEQPSAWQDTLRTAERAARAGAAHLVSSRSRLAMALFSHETPEQALERVVAETRSLIADEISRRYARRRSPPSLSAVTPGAVTPAASAPMNPAPAPAWSIQPLQGAAAYLAGRPGWGVAVALEMDGSLRVAVVVDPANGWVYRALVGHGAERLTLPGHPARAPGARAMLAPSGRMRLADARVLTCFPAPGSPAMVAHSREFGRLVGKCADLRRCGSVSLAMAAVASGDADAMWHHPPPGGPPEPGLLLLQEARASVRSRDAAPLLASASIAACTPPLAFDFYARLADL